MQLLHSVKHTVGGSADIREQSRVRASAARARRRRTDCERVQRARRETSDNERRGVRAGADRSAGARRAVDEHCVVRNDAVRWRRRRPVQLD